MDLFRAVAHAFATIATAGFSTEGRSIEPFAPATQWVIMVFMIVAGTNFALMFAAIVRRSARPFARDEEFRVYLAILALASAIVALELVTEDIFEGEAAVRHAVFNVMSMMTTTGFASSDFNEWTALTDRSSCSASSLIGASAGSTSGSIKLVRHVVIAKMLRRELDQTLHPHRVAPLRVNGAVVDERALRAIIVFVFLYIGVLLAGARRDPDRLLAARRAADRVRLARRGGHHARRRRPGLGFAGPMGSFAPFSDVSTVVLTALMYLGRLEIIPVLVLFTRSHWQA